jgi:hypothetical protein
MFYSGFFKISTTEAYITLFICPVTVHNFVTVSWSWSSSCGRQSVDQCVWVSGLSLGPLTRFYLALLTLSDNYFFLLSKAPSLTRKRVCSLQCDQSQSQSQSYFTTDDQSVSMSWCLAQSGTIDQSLLAP